MKKCHQGMHREISTKLPTFDTKKSSLYITHQTQKMNHQFIYPISHPTRGYIQTNYQSRTIPASR